MLPRAQFDVSALLLPEEPLQRRSQEGRLQGEDRRRDRTPDTWEEVTKQAEFFASPPDFYGTQFAGKEEAINGRFYEMVIAEGGEYLDKDKQACLQFRGRRARARLVRQSLQGEGRSGRHRQPASGTISARALPSGTVALNLDWPGWARPSSMTEGVQGRRQCRRQGSAQGLVGQAHRLARPSRLLGHRKLRQQGGCRLARLVADQRGQPEAEAGRRPAADPHGRVGLGTSSRPMATLQNRGLKAFQEAAENAFAGAADGRRGSRSPMPSIRSCRQPSSATRPRKQALDDAAAKATHDP